MKSRGSQHPHEALSAYLDGELSHRETQDVADHLRDCAACRALLDDLRAMAGAIRDDVPPVPAGLHDAVRRKLGFDPASAAAAVRRTPAWRRPWALAAAATIVAAAAVSVFVSQHAERTTWDISSRAQAPATEELSGPAREKSEADHGTAASNTPPPAEQEQAMPAATAATGARAATAATAATAPAAAHEQKRATPVEGEARGEIAERREGLALRDAQDVAPVREEAKSSAAAARDDASTDRFAPEVDARGAESTDAAGTRMRETVVIPQREAPAPPPPPAPTAPGAAGGAAAVGGSAAARGAAAASTPAATAEDSARGTDVARAAQKTARESAPPAAMQRNLALSTAPRGPADQPAVIAVPVIRVKAADKAAFWSALEAFVGSLGGRLAPREAAPRPVWIAADRVPALHEWLRARGATGLPAANAPGAPSPPSLPGATAPDRPALAIALD